MSKEQSEFPKNFLAISLKTGILSAFLMIMFIVINYLIIGSTSRPVLLWNHMILLVIMFVAVKIYRKQLKGYINFKQCYISGLFNGIFASLFFAVFVYFNTKFIDKELIKNFISVNEVAMNQYINGEELKRQTDILYQFSTPFFMSVRAAGELILISIFLPLLMSIFLKRERKIEEVANTNDE